jgi:hypothetical protein
MLLSKASMSYQRATTKIFLAKDHEGTILVNNNDDDNNNTIIILVFMLIAIILDQERISIDY